MSLVIDAKIKALHDGGMCIVDCPCCDEQLKAYHAHGDKLEKLDAHNPLEGAQFSPTLDRMMSAEIAAANAHLDAKEAKIDSHGYAGAERVVPVGLHPFIPHSDPTTNAIARMTAQRDEARAMKDVAEREMIAYRDKCSKLEERIERFEKSVSPSDAMRARVHKADDENRRLGEIVDEQAEYISKLEAHINILTNAKGKDPVAMRRALIGVTDKIAAPYHEEAQRLRAGIVEISKERDTLSEELKQRRYETAEIRDALVVYVLRYLKHKGESDAMALRLAKLAATHALCNHAKPPESVHPSNLSTVIEVLEDEARANRAERAELAHQVRGLEEQLADARGMLAIADSDRVPLRMDLDEAKKTIARMQPIIDAVQKWEPRMIALVGASNPRFLEDAQLLEAAKAYEMACAQAANAEEIETGISSPDDDIPF